MVKIEAKNPSYHNSRETHETYAHPLHIPRNSHETMKLAVFQYHQVGYYSRVFESIQEYLRAVTYSFMRFWNWEYSVLIFYAQIRTNEIFVFQNKQLSTVENTAQ